MSAHSEWPTLLPFSAKDLEKEKNGDVCVMLVRHVKQFYSRGLKLF